MRREIALNYLMAKSVDDGLASSYEVSDLRGYAGELFNVFVNLTLLAA